MVKKYLAHLKNDSGKFHYLDDHLLCVGEIAENFINDANKALAEQAKWAGLLHDLGKYRDEFQEYMKSEGKIASSKETHHAVYGAALAFQRLQATRNLAWYPIVFAILAHHGKLHNRGELEGKFQEYETEKAVPPLVEKFEKELGMIPENLSDNGFLKNTLQIEFATRMIFSALVDADRIDTAQHANNGKPTETLKLNPSELLEKLEKVRREKSENAEQSRVDKTLIELRNKIFADCLKKAEHRCGFFSLTVPTGGAKTLASMAFALKHAEIHGKRRVIVVIPYLSIIEQNAKEYRKVFGDEVVIENHSAIEIKENSDDKDDLNRLSLITENWDAPIIVTTSVQFIESLFSNRTTKNRKLHNIANSVVIFDEIQTLPAKLLEPLFSVWRELVENYGVSFVFSTATQPAFKKNDFNFTKGLEKNELTEITEQTEEIYKTLNRVNYEFKDFQKPKTWTLIGDEMKAESQVMSVLNTRKHAFELWNELSGKLAEPQKHGIYHLSSAMCAEHRLQTIETIKIRLKNGETCKVVSTQLVEAGVDLDFPVLFRAIAPLDSIVQAAGRCNREGKLKDNDGNPMKGRVVVFTPENDVLPKGTYKNGTRLSERILPKIDSERLSTDHKIFTSYFSNLYSDSVDDLKIGKEIQRLREKWRFKDVAYKDKTINTKVIEDSGTPVIVHYKNKDKDSSTIIDEIREFYAAISEKRQNKVSKKEMWADLNELKKMFRKLQRFTVNLREKEFKELNDQGKIKMLLPYSSLEMFVLDDETVKGKKNYDENLGVIVKEFEATDFIQ